MSKNLMPTNSPADRRHRPFQLHDALQTLGYDAVLHGSPGDPRRTRALAYVGAMTERPPTQVLTPGRP